MQLSQKTGIAVSTFAAVGSALALAKASYVLGQLGHVDETCTQAIDQLFMKCISGWGEGIINPSTILPRIDEAAAAQIAQMPGRRGLRNAQYLNQITDADFTLAKHVENPQSRAV